MNKLGLYRQFVMALVSVPLAANASADLGHIHSVKEAFDVMPACHLPSGVVSHSTEKDMPVALRDAVKEKLGKLVPPKEPFDATDVIVTGRNRRLIFIWSKGDRWVVATEHGGFVYNDPILAYTVGPSGQVKLIAERIAYPNTVCIVAEALLNQQANAL